jgi:hypothetical protein
MTPHQTLAVAVRLFAILLALLVAREVFWAYLDWREEDAKHLAPIVMLGLVMSIILFAVLWFFPKNIAKGLLPLSSATPVQHSTPDAWLAVGSSLIGLWLATSALPALTTNLTTVFILQSESVDKSELNRGLLYYTVQFTEILSRVVD